MELSEKTAKPFLKWAGGKRKLVPKIQSLMPKEYSTYYEPFLGGGALFFATQPDNAVLADSNKELVNTYIQVRDNVERLIGWLSNEQLKHDSSSRDLQKYWFDTNRTLFNHTIDVLKTTSDLPSDSIKRLKLIQAVKLIYLNKTCFNGLYRVNKSGYFNVPMGDYEKPVICDRENLLRCSEALQGVELLNWDFRQTITLADDHDFVYADPPYVPVSATANFSSYSADGFGEIEQLSLLAELRDLDRCGATWITSNSFCDWVREKYYGYTFHSVTRNGSINSDTSKRSAVKELLISNPNLTT